MDNNAFATKRFECIKYCELFLRENSDTLNESALDLW